jgi:hypothetical protein
MSRTVQYTHVPETNFFAALTYPCQRLGGNGIIMTFLKSLFHGMVFQENSQ